jgi:putative hydrolase of the HAD superfamily
MLKKFKNLLLILILLVYQSGHSINIIFDLSGVLLKTNKKYVISKVGFYNFLMYLIKLNNPFSLKTRLFETLTNIPTTTKNIFGTPDDGGKILPDVMCDWLSGQKTSTEIKNLLLNFMKNNEHEFCNYEEKEILNKLIDLIFTPQQFINSKKISKKGLKFVKKCKENGHKIFILSNWDRESYLLLTKTYPELFSLFEEKNIVFSGQIGLIKPDPKIYEYIVKKNNLNPKECIFFDDQEVNVKSANQFGIYSVLYKKSEYGDMIKKLNDFIKIDHKQAGNYVKN